IVIRAGNGIERRVSERNQFRVPLAVSGTGGLVIIKDGAVGEAIAYAAQAECSPETANALALTGIMEIDVDILVKLDDIVVRDGNEYPLARRAGAIGRKRQGDGGRRIIARIDDVCGSISKRWIRKGARERV